MNECKRSCVFSQYRSPDDDTALLQTPGGVTSTAACAASALVQSRFVRGVCRSTSATGAIQAPLDVAVFRTTVYCL
ncbi:hypothetical protein WA026_007053 [Henosepilachna vigintioctopunctata]|uniref:Uncharacterized protein n=1 Tax=Henosepilachna vigintioctopunctata TaxID=420089 RepID=A0AAW1V962_9CUCU